MAARDVDVIEAQDLVVRFGGLIALNRVNLTVPRASLVGLVGPNGAGKSTLFGACSGLLRPTSGVIRLDGEDVTDASPAARSRKGLARTFQRPELFLGLTVRQHVQLAHRMRRGPLRVWTDLLRGASLGRPDAAEATQVDELIEQVSLTSVADRLVDALPLGTARLIEVARALATEPSVVLLDEPLSGLDVMEAGRLTEALCAVVQERGTSLLLVEHDVATVLNISSRIYVLDFGQIIAEGRPEDVRADEAVKAAYLGTDVRPGPGAAAVEMSS